ncbi:MAG: GNAT family N-acetyltransferase [Pseudomonadota bacterium]
MGYQLVKYDPRYRDGILQLQTHLWSPDHKLNSDYFTWKYDENPYLDAPLIYLVLHDQRVVAMRGLFGAKWHLGATGDSILLPCAGDTTIDPEHRKRGLLRKLFRFMLADPAVAGYPFLLSLSAGQAVYFAQLKEGWRVIAPYDTVLRAPTIVKSSKLRPIRRLARRLAGRSLARMLLSAAERAKGSGKRTDRVRLSEAPRPDDMANLVARMGRPDKICHVRDRDYFAWRFRSPLANYRYVYWQGTALEGFMVLRVLPHAIGTANIVEWQAANDDVLRDMLLAAIWEVGYGGIAIWTATLPQTAIDLLHGLGFSPADDDGADGSFRPSILTTCDAKTDAETDWMLADRSITDHRNWDLRMLNSDAH